MLSVYLRIKVRSLTTTDNDGGVGNSVVMCATSSSASGFTGSWQLLYWI